MSNEKEFASASYTAGQLNAMVKNIRDQAGENGPELLLRNKLIIIKSWPCWHEDDNVIYFSVTSKGITGKEWVARHNDNVWWLVKPVENVLLDPDFETTSGVTTHVAVLRNIFPEETDWPTLTSRIRAEAKRRGFKTPSAEIACLIREKINDDVMYREMGGLWQIYVMHRPIKDSAGIPRLIGTHCGSNASRHLGTDINEASALVADTRRKRLVHTGFAFVVTQLRSSV